MAAPKLASTTLLIAPLEGSSSNLYRILMVRRSKKARFMAGAHVFPGGVLEESDSDEKWSRLVHPTASSLARPELAMLIGSLRELFEETGVLLSSPPLHSLNPTARDYVEKALIEFRVRVRKDSKEFARLFDFWREGGGADAAGDRSLTSLSPAVHTLRPWSRWITPKEEKWRYDTYFYVAVIDTPPRYVKQDDDETTTIDWFSPVEALYAHEKGTVQLPPPTWLTLLEFSQTPTLHSLLDAISPGRRSMEPIMPSLILDQDSLMMVCLPGDAEHPESKLKVPVKSRNRISFHPGRAGENIKYELESTVDPYQSFKFPDASIVHSSL